MFIEVESHTGHLGEQEPSLLLMGERAVRVAEILDRWWAPEHRYCKLRGSDGALYIVRYDVPSARWELVLYERDATSPHGAHRT
jgi:hypothetical protein